MIDKDPGSGGAPGGGNGINKLNPPGPWWGAPFAKHLANGLIPILPGKGWCMGFPHQKAESVLGFLYFLSGG